MASRWSCDETVRYRGIGGGGSGVVEGAEGADEVDSDGAGGWTGPDSTRKTSPAPSQSLEVMRGASTRTNSSLCGQIEASGLQQLDKCEVEVNSHQNAPPPRVPSCS